MAEPPTIRPRPQALFVLALTCGVLVGGAVVGTAYRSPGPSRPYGSVGVSVPAGAHAPTPYVVSFDGATFSLGWPDLAPGAYSGVPGVSILIAEPSGIVDRTGTGCGACGFDHRT